jgi:hypothetical protein
MNANKSANVCFYDLGNSQKQGDKISPEKRCDNSAALAFPAPLSVASKSAACQGKTHRGEQHRCERHGWCSSLTRRSGETGNFRTRRTDSNQLPPILMKYPD